MIFVVTNSLQAQANSDFGKQSLLFAYVNSEFELIEEFAVDSRKYTGNDYYQNSVGVNTLPVLSTRVDYQRNEQLTSTQQGGGALVKPDLPSAHAPRQSEREDIETYIVQSGDTLSTIATNFGVSTNTILWQNNLSSSSLIRPGQKLEILPITGLTHSVKSGETLSEIASDYDADETEILAFNSIDDASQIRAGQNLIIPNGTRVAQRTTSIVSAPRPTLAPITQIFNAPTAPLTGTTLQWPTDGHVITQYFSWRHTALDIDGIVGSPIFAPEDGVVIRSGWGTGYGYHIIIDHGNGMHTLTAHHSQLYVNVGDRVTRGQLVALMGSTGWSTGSHTHFEVRINGVKQNPLAYTR